MTRCQGRQRRMPVASAVKMGKFEGVLFSGDGELAQHHAKIKRAVAGEKLKQFGALTKAEEQAKFVLGLQGCEGPKVEATINCRDIEKAREFKEKGNDSFRKNMYLDAFTNYTLAIQVDPSALITKQIFQFVFFQHCPVDEANPVNPVNKDYSIMFANRCKGSKN